MRQLRFRRGHVQQRADVRRNLVEIDFPSIRQIPHDAFEFEVARVGRDGLAERYQGRCFAILFGPQRLEPREQEAVGVAALRAALFALVEDGLVEAVAPAPIRFVGKQVAGDRVRVLPPQGSFDRMLVAQARVEGVIRRDAAQLRSSCCAVWREHRDGLGLQNPGDATEEGAQ